MLKNILLLSLSLIALNAEIKIHSIQSSEGYSGYKEPLFNNKISVVSGCMKVKEALESISKATGYAVINNSLMDVTKPICNLNKFDTVGEVLEAVVNEDSKVFYKDDDPYNRSIIIEPAEEIITTFPIYWDTANTANLLKKDFPNIKWTFYGNVVKAQGNKRDLAAIEDKLAELRDYSMRTISTSINVSDVLMDNEDILNRNRVVIIQRMNKEDKVTYRMQVSHGNSIHIDELPTAIQFDLQKNIVFIGNKSIPINELGNLAFLYKGKQISINFGTFFYNGEI